MSYETVIDRLRALPSETEWVEFKLNHCAPQRLGEYVSALANAAALARQPRGYLLFGVDDASHKIVGTRFDPYTEKGSGNQDLLPWLAAGLQPKAEFQSCAVEHPAGRVVIFEVLPARERPVTFYGKAHIRVGSSLSALSNYPEKERALWMLNRDWSAETCSGASMEDLDPDALSYARTQFKVKHPGQSSEVEGWDNVKFLNKARVLRQGAMTNAALLLLGRPETAPLLSPSVAKMSWILKDGSNREQDYAHFGPPFLLAGDRLLSRIRNLTIRALPSGTLFPQEISQYDPWVIREALHNCIAHQDYGLHGRIGVVEFPDRILLVNEGSFLPGDVETVIRQDAPQTVYRNQFLADAMVELNMIDTQGGGIKRMYETQRRRLFPLPDYDLSHSHRVAVSISGRILDERYAKLLMERADLDIWQVILLDRVQKSLPISQEARRMLKSAGLVEGRSPNLIIAAPIAKVTGQKAQHIRNRGLENEFYLRMITELVKTHGPVSREEIDRLLLDKLPDVLTPDQRKSKIHNLLGQLSREGVIINTGSRARPAWRMAQGE